MNGRVLGCKVIKHSLEQLAAQYQHVKFINMQSTDCIPNYPDSNLPTLLVYRDGQCARTIVGLRTLGGVRISPESELNSYLQSMHIAPFHTMSFHSTLTCFVELYSHLSITVLNRRAGFGRCGCWIE